jgi:5'-phosphate synthase pdxT subunit
VAGKIGILALQGAFTKHEQLLKALAIPVCQVRYAHELQHCIGLIIPGGESTTMTWHIKEMELAPSLKKFAQKHPLFGTCAGLIIMSKEGILPVLEVSVSRNAYGRQCASFSAPLHVPFSSEIISAFFIRAPRITAVHSEKVKVLATEGNAPVLVQQGFHLAASFHPELSGNTAIHTYFYEICKMESGR